MPVTGYRAVSRLVHALPLRRGTLGRSLIGRRGAAGRWAAWADDAHREDGAPLIWTHAASVGEALAAEPVIRRLRQAHPGSRHILTFSSASASAWPGFPYVDRADFVPLDDPGAVAHAMRALRPSLILFSRSDLWPELIGAATTYGVPVAITGGTVRAGSARLRWPGRTLLRSIHERVRYAGVVSDDDAERWERLGVPSEAIHVTGDPRHAQILERVPQLGTVMPLRAWATEAPLLVAGSVERSDIDMMLRGMGSVIRGGGRVLVVPHSPTTDTLREWSERLERSNLAAGVWRGPGSPVPDRPVLLVGMTGLLQDLYLSADVAYVGGGFRAGGLHAVAEPAALGVPVIVGPRWDADRDATRLVRAGGAVALPRSAPGAALLDVWRRWTGDPTERWAAGLLARRCIEGDAADRDAAGLTSVLLAALSGSRSSGTGRL